MPPASKANRRNRKLFKAGAASPAVLVARPVAIPQIVPADRSRKEELAELRREQKRFQDALFQAAQIQRKLCAPRELRRGPCDVAGEMFPVRHLSGDFLKVLDLRPAIGLAVGDIAGKGLSAGLWLAHLVGLVHSRMNGHALPAAMAAINHELCELLSEPPMVALFLARLDPQTGELAYCNAGQPAPLLLRRQGTVETLRAGGPMLGALSGAEFESGCVTLERGDTLVAYTDGVTECRNPRGEEFGNRRLAVAAEGAAGVSAGHTLFSTLGAVLDFAGGRALEDDVTLLVVRRRGSLLS